jgi:hypothetical protein
MANTQNKYTGNGSTKLFSFTFPYINEEDVKVTLDAVNTTEYTFANATTISFNTAPANGVQIVIYRDTESDSLVNTFYPGSAIRARDLNDNFTQTLYIVEELDNNADASLDTADEALATAQRAENTANEASDKSDIAVSSANAAQSTADSALSKANQAQDAADQASTDASNAADSASAAQASADAAQSEAAEAAALAQQAADDAALVSTVVDTANEAKADAAQALTTAEGALSSVTDDTAAGAITFEKLTTHEAGVGVTGGIVAVTGTADGRHFYANNSTGAGATTNYGFFSNIGGTGNYNFFAAGDSPNVFEGNVGIGTTGPEGKLVVRPGGTPTTTIAGRDMSVGVMSKSASGRSAFTVLIENNYTEDSGEAGYYWIYPFDSGGNPNYKVFRSSVGETLVDKCWINQAGGAYFAGDLQVDGNIAGVPTALNVKDFGAVGDGVANDTNAFKAAIAAASTQDGPKKIWVPYGTYLIKEPLLVSGNGITIEGEGIGSSLLSAGAPCSRLFLDFDGFGINCTGERFVLKSIELYGSTSRYDDVGGSQSGDKAAIGIGNGIATRLERVSIYREPGIGVYTYGNSVSSVYSQVSVEKCKGLGFLFSKGQNSANAECGIITMDTCRVARCDGAAVMAGNPNDSELSAYRIIQLNCEYFFCGGFKAIHSMPASDHVVRLNGDNHTMIGCAVRGPINQPGGVSTTKGEILDGVTADTLVKGVYVNGRNNLLLNNRYINVYAFGVTISQTSTYCKVDGAELRSNGSFFTYGVDIQQGAKGYQIERVGRDQCTNPSNDTSTKANASTLAVKTEGERIRYTVNGDGLVVEPGYLALTANSSNALRVDTSTLETRLYGDLRFNNAGDGIKLMSPDGTIYTLTVDNAGSIQVS